MLELYPADGGSFDVTTCKLIDLQSKRIIGEFSRGIYNVVALPGMNMMIHSITCELSNLTASESLPSEPTRIAVEFGDNAAQGVGNAMANVSGNKITLQFDGEITAMPPKTDNPSQ